MPNTNIHKYLFSVLLIPMLFFKLWPGPINFSLHDFYKPAEVVTLEI